jgi:hypothetical protein
VLDLPDRPVLDKHALVGGCVRLPLRCDAAPLASEIAALPAELWGNTGGRVGVHRAAEAIFLRGFAPAEGDRPIEDRPALASLPHVRKLLEETIPAVPMRTLLAKLPAGAVIAPHIDRAPYFSQTLRLHIPVTTNESAHMFCDGSFYRMRSGEIWALNNCAVHAVWNAHADAARIHLICDFLPSQALLDLLLRGERNLGEVDTAREQALRARAGQSRAA